MPKQLQRSITDYLSKMKRPSSNVLFSPRSFSFSSGKSWIKSCKHPRTLSFAVDVNLDKSRDNHNNNNNDDDSNKKCNKHSYDESATLSDIDRFLLENFRSLYLTEDEENEKKEKNRKKKEKEKGSESNNDLSGSPRFEDLPPDLSASQRFFVARGASGSIIEEARVSLPTTTTATTTTTTTTTNTSEDIASSSTSHETLDYSFEFANDDSEVTLPNDCIAVLKHSPTPYDDFRRSMQEIVEAKLRSRAKLDWEIMEELLFCYLGLNDKKSYKFILSAFIDTMIVLREQSGNSRARSRNLRMARERRRKILRFVK